MHHGSVIYSLHVYFISKDKLSDKHMALSESYCDLKSHDILKKKKKIELQFDIKCHETFCTQYNLICLDIRAVTCLQHSLSRVNSGTAQKRHCFHEQYTIVKG